MGIWVDNTHGLGKITNYGIMGSIDYGANSNRITTILTLNSLGLIGAKQHHLKVMNGSKILIQNYSVMINEMASTFNSFSGLNDKTNNFSHLVINTNNGNGGSITFKDGNSKIILDFDNGFELGKKYLINKVAINQDVATPALGVDFPRLTT